MPGTIEIEVFMFNKHKRRDNENHCFAFRLLTVNFYMHNCRFGDSDLQKCEVMLKDVSDSHRMNTRFYEEGSVLSDQV